MITFEEDLNMAVSMTGKTEFPACLHFDPVQNITDFIRNCRHKGMNKTKTAGEMVDHLHFFPTEADIIVNEFWDKTA